MNSEQDRPILLTVHCSLIAESMKLYSTSRIQRRLGERLFLKAERDATPKSAMARRPYPPGLHGSRRRRGLSEFGSALREKQKIRFLYGMSNAQLKRYATAAAHSPKTSRTHALIERLERRLDSIVFRMGFAPSRRVARQMVSHGHFLVNGRRVRSPSRLLRPGDRVAVREASRAHPAFAGLAVRLKKYQPPEWLGVSAEEWGGRMIGLPAAVDNQASLDIGKAIEFYSR